MQGTRFGGSPWSTHRPARAPRISGRLEQRLRWMQFFIAGLGGVLFICVLFFDAPRDRTELVGAWRYENPEQYRVWRDPLPYVNVIEFDVAEGDDDVMVHSLRIEATCPTGGGWGAAAWSVPGPFPIDEDGTFVARWRDELGESVVRGSFSDDQVLEYVTRFLQSAHAADEPYTVRDGVNVARYALKLLGTEKTSAEAALRSSITNILGEEALRHFPT